MARKEEKAQSMLNRFLQAKVDEQRGPKARRPYLATECTDLNEADKWRQQILREIGRKVMEIQNAGLGEHRCVCRQAAWGWVVLAPHCCGVGACTDGLSSS
jgi:pre-mRNA-splicing factor ISY1